MILENLVPNIIPREISPALDFVALSQGSLKVYAATNSQQRKSKGLNIKIVIHITLYAFINLPYKKTITIVYAYGKWTKALIPII